MSTETELLPCPFCGATPHRGPTKATTDQLRGERLQRYRIWCPRQHANIEATNEVQATEAWNDRRALAPAAPADAGAVAYRWRKPTSKVWQYQTAPTRVSYEGMEFEYLYATPTAAGVAVPTANSTFDGRMLHAQYDGNGRPRPVPLSVDPAPPASSADEVTQALDSSQDLLATIYHIGSNPAVWAEEDIEIQIVDQMADNRAALTADAGAQTLLATQSGGAT